METEPWRFGSELFCVDHLANMAGVDGASFDEAGSLFLLLLFSH
jgi:hypothetical protein